MCARQMRWSLGVTALLLVPLGCSRGSKTSPPDEALRVMQGVRDGYSSDDADKFCADFGDIMFTKGFTKQAYLDVIQGLKAKLGDWQSETYLGMEDVAHTWQVKFAKGGAKLVLVLNDESKVTGLWFR